MIGNDKLNPQFINNESGEKCVILPISEFQERIEDIEDLAAVAERRDEPTISHADVLKELRIAIT